MSGFFVILGVAVVLAGLALLGAILDWLSRPAR